MNKALEVSRGSRAPSPRNMRDFDDMFERVFRNPFTLLDELRPSMLMEPTWFQPTYDVDETDDAYLLSVDLPGVKKDDVKIDVTENVLTVSGERKYENEEKQKGMRRYERSYGQFQRSFSMPGTVDVDHVEAHLEDGVLRIALPKSEKAKPKAIEVQSGKGNFFSKLIGSSKKDGEKETGSKTTAH